MYRSYSALAVLIRFSLWASYSVPTASLYPTFATDGRIFQLETLASSLGDSCIEKEYLLALVDLGRAAFVASDMEYLRNASRTEMQQCANSLRAEILEAIFSQQCVLISPKQIFA